MTPSRKERKTRSVFDVQTEKAERPSRPLSERVYGKNVLNLKPGFGKRHPWWTALVLAVLVIGIFLGIRKLSTRAEVSDFFPLTCLGSWQNPVNAQGKPESLNDASGTAISPSIAAVYDPASAPSSQIYCGVFVPPDYKAAGNITSVGLTLVWDMPGFESTSTAPGATATATTATTTAPESSTTAPATPTTTPTTTSQNPPLKPFALFFNVAFADTTDTASTVSTSSGTTTPPPAPPPPSTSTAPATPATASTTGQPAAPAPTSSSPTSSTPAPTPTPTTTEAATTVNANANTTNTSTSTNEGTTTTSTVVTLPPLTATLSPVSSTTPTASGTQSGTSGTAGGGSEINASGTTTTGTVETNTSGTTTTAPIFTPPPPPDSNFLKISYSLDGQNWIELAKVSPTNWQDFTANLPVKSWDDLKKLQVKIEGVPTSLTQIPKVYLDGMFIEAHYEVPPPLPISLGGGGSAAPAATEGTASSSVIVLPPTQQPVPVNQNGNFKADQSPTFDFNLNALPAPTSAPPAP